MSKSIIFVCLAVVFCFLDIVFLDCNNPKKQRNTAHVINDSLTMQSVMQMPEDSIDTAKFSDTAEKKSYYDRPDEFFELVDTLL